MIDRVRARIEAAWATTHGFRSGDNPARWKGNLATTLPRKSKVVNVEHFAALPYSKLPAFMAGCACPTVPSHSATKISVST